MSKGSAPAAPDYTAAANAQGAANLTSAQQTGVLSNPNVKSPYGDQSVSYTNVPNPDGTGTPFLQPTVTQTLTPQAQQTLSAQQQVQTGEANLGLQGLSTAQNVMGTPFSFGGPAVQTSVPSQGAVPTSIDTSGVAQMPVNAGTTGQAAIESRLAPLQARQMQSEQTQLANQGLVPGDEAYTNAMTDFTNQQNDAQQQAVLNGLNLDMSANNQGFGQAQAQAQIGQAGQGQQYNQALQSGKFGNTAQQQALAQALNQYNLPLNQINSLMSGSQIQSPQFTPYTGANVAPAPIANAATQQAQYNQGLYGLQQGAANQNTAAIGQLGSAALMAYALA